MSRKKHRHSLWYRIKRWYRHNKKMTVGSILLGAAVAGGGIAFLAYHQQMQNGQQITAGNSVNVGSGYRNITCNGKNYQYNTLITNVLYAGIDSTGEMKASGGYGDQARADSISLIVMDKKKKKMSVIAISRDTMTEIHRYTLDGKDRGAGKSHLGFAYTYGDGGEASCENLVRAVSDLFGGIPIRDYVVTNQSSMPYINDLVGGVTVTVPNDELATQYPEMTAGAAVKLDETNITDYLHYRDTAGDFSNEGRMERQKSFINAYIPIAKEQAKNDPDGMWEKLQEMEDYLQTSITKNKYLGLVNLLDQITYTEEDFYRLEGQDQMGELHDEFYPDQERLQEKILELFYEEI